MDLNENVGAHNRLARVVLAAMLAVAAIRSLRQGKRVTGGLAGVGALALGYTLTTESGGLRDAVGGGATGEDVELRCASCGEPIRPGQLRGPNENDEIVHEACMESPEQ